MHIYLLEPTNALYKYIYSHVDTTETPYRYAAYANRARTILLSAQRYVAYTSDIGESFRPVAHPYLVRSAYAISWSYILGDVLHEGYKAYLRNTAALTPGGDTYRNAVQQSSKSNNNTTDKSVSVSTRPQVQIPLIDDYKVVTVKRAVFQTLASMGLPAFTIHSVVKYSGRVFRKSKVQVVRTWAPIGVSRPHSYISHSPFHISLPHLFFPLLNRSINQTKSKKKNNSWASSSSQPCLISSTNPSKKQLTGHSVKVYVLLPVNKQSNHPTIATITITAMNKRMKKMIIIIIHHHGERLMKRKVNRYMIKIKY